MVQKYNKYWRGYFEHTESILEFEEKNFELTKIAIKEKWKETFKFYRIVKNYFT